MHPIYLNHGMRTLATWPTVASLAVAVVTDLRSRRIPNWLVFPLMAAGLAFSLGVGGWPGLARSLEGLGLGAGIYGLLCLLGGMGMGDVKLCAAIGSWIGPGQLLVAMVFTAVAGGLMAVGWAASCGFLGELLDGSGALAERLGGILIPGLRRRGEGEESAREIDPGMTLADPARRRMPYAPAIAAGTLLSFFSQ